MQRATRWSMQGTDFIVGDGCGVVNATARGAKRRMDLLRGSLTVARRSSKLLVSTGRAIRRSARAANKQALRSPAGSQGESPWRAIQETDRCRNALFSRTCGADIKSTGFASA